MAKFRKITSQTVKRRLVSTVILASVTCIAAALFVSYAIFLTQKADRQTNELSESHKRFLNIQNDHLVWSIELSTYIKSNNPGSLAIILDGRKCRLGEYIYAPGNQEFFTRFPAIQKELEQLHEPHLELHRTARKIQDVIGRSKDLAETIFNEETVPLMKVLRDSLTRIEAILDHEKKETVRYKALVLSRIYLAVVIALVTCLLAMLLVFTQSDQAIKKIISLEQSRIESENSLKIASDIQNSILPGTIPDTGRFTVSTRYIPMDLLGGDFYDYVRIDDSRYCFLIADVTGHGVGAALIASMVKMAFASSRSNYGDPARLLDDINTALFDKLKDQFVTAAAVYFDFEKMKFTVANAGHPPIYHFRKMDGTISALKPKGRVIGMIERSIFESATISCGRGDRIIMFTDGIIEFRNTKRECFGEERFKSFIRENRNLSCQELSDRLLETLGAWSTPGSLYNDDLTLIVLEIS